MISSLCLDIMEKLGTLEVKVIEQNVKVINFDNLNNNSKPERRIEKGKNCRKRVSKGSNFFTCHTKESTDTG